MQIVIKKDAHKIYNRSFKPWQVPNMEWLNILSKVAGKTLEVETEYLFKNQYNTAPIPGVNENGLRIMSESVEKVINDIRPGLMRCNYCGKQAKISDVCPHCKETKYLEFLAIEDIKKYGRTTVNKPRTETAQPEKTEIKQLKVKNDFYWVKTFSAVYNDKTLVKTGAPVVYHAKNKTYYVKSDYFNTPFEQNDAKIHGCIVDKDNII